MCLTLGLKAEFKVNLRRIRVEFTLNSMGMSALQFILSSFVNVQAWGRSDVPTALPGLADRALVQVSLSNP